MDVDADIDYKELYKKMKRKLKILIYENECFQEELRKSQRVLLQVQRDKSFLLDRILQYQQGPDTTSDSEETEESEAEVENNKDNKRKKTSSDSTSFASLPPQSGSRGSTAKKKKNTLTGNSSRTANNHKQNSKIKASQSTVARQSQKGKDSWVSQYQKKTVQKRSNKLTPSNSLQNLSLQKSLDHQTLHPQSVDHKTVHPHSSSSRWTVLSNQTQLPMTREEVERQLAARQPFSDFATTVSLTLPNQLFSDNLLEADLLEDFDTSPSNVEDESLIDSFD